MPLRRVLGLIGSLVLAIGVFVPILSVPIVGSINYFKNGQGDGTIVLLLTLVSLLLIVQRRFEWLLTTGVGSLAVVLFTFINFRMKLADIQAGMDSKLADNPFRGLADVFAQSVQIQWGWMLLVIGSCLLIAAAVVRESIDAFRNCPFCAEPIQPAARVCKHCKSEVVPENMPTDPAPASCVFPRRVVIVTVLLVLVVPGIAWALPRIPALITHCDWQALECVWG